MTLLFEWLPMLTFFAAYQWKGLYLATACLMGVSTLQMFTYWMSNKTIPPFQWISFLFLTVMGTATLVTQNSLLIKLKPSLMYWALATGCAVSTYWRNTNLVKHFLDPLLDLPERLWIILNRCWIVFFICLGALNAFLAFILETPHWIYFKVFGLLSIKLLFLLLQILYLWRFIKVNHARS